MACWSMFIIVIGTFMTIAGTYGSIVSIIDSLKLARTIPTLERYASIIHMNFISCHVFCT